MALQNGMRSGTPEAVKTVFDSNLKIDMVAFRKYKSSAFDIRCAPKWADEREFVGIDF